MTQKISLTLLASVPRGKEIFYLIMHYNYCISCISSENNGCTLFISHRSSEIDQVKAQVVSLEEEISQLNSEREELLAEIDAATSDANTNIESLTAEKVSMTYTFLPIKFLKTRSDTYLIGANSDLTLIILNC